jgi:hypothetical protein
MTGARERMVETTDPRRWRALLVTLAGGFMVLLDITIVTVAVPSIQSGLGARRRAACSGWCPDIH